MNTSLQKEISNFVILLLGVMLIALGASLIVNAIFADWIMNPQEAVVSPGKQLTVLFWSIIISFISALALSTFLLKRSQLPTLQILLLLSISINLYGGMRYVVKSFTSYIIDTNFGFLSTDIIGSILAIGLGIIILTSKKS